MEDNLPTPDKRHNHPFTVPDRYFEQLPMRIQQRVQAPAHRHSSWLPQAVAGYRWQLALATVLVLAAGMWFTLQQQKPAYQAAQITLADLTPTEINRYLAANYYALDPTDFVSLASAEELMPAPVPALNPEELEDQVDQILFEEYYL